MVDGTRELVRKLRENCATAMNLGEPEADGDPHKKRQLIAAERPVDDVATATASRVDRA